MLGSLIIVKWRRPLFLFHRRVGCYLIKLQLKTKTKNLTVMVSKIQFTFESLTEIVIVSSTCEMQKSDLDPE